MSNIIILTLQIQELLLIASIRMQFSINVNDKSDSVCFTRNSWKAIIVYIIHKMIMNKSLQALYTRKYVMNIDLK